MSDIRPGDKLKPGAALDWLREDCNRRVRDKYSSHWRFSVTYQKLSNYHNHWFDADEVDFSDLLSSTEVTVL